MAELRPGRSRLEVYRREDDRWAWRLVVNEEIVATDHSQGYENRLDAQTMGERVLSGEFANLEVWQIDD